MHLDQGTETFQPRTNEKEMDGTVAAHQNTNGEKLDRIRTSQDAGSVVFPQKIDREILDGAMVGPEGEAVQVQVILAGTLLCKNNLKAYKFSLQLNISISVA